MKTLSSTRRSFLAISGLGLAGAALAQVRPPVTQPKATSGDGVAEPDWEKRLSISVGPRKADLVGTNEKVLQAAVDYMAAMGGGRYGFCRASIGCATRCICAATCGCSAAGRRAS